MGLFSSLFGGNNKTEENKQEKQEKKNFEILKYDGIRARNIRQLPYAIKCFEEATAIKEDVETMTLLAVSYLQTGKNEESRKTYIRLSEIEPLNMDILLSLANVCFIMEDYESMNKACIKAIQIDENNKTAYYLSAKAEKALNNQLQAIVMLTKAITHDADFIEAYLLRAETLWKMNQVKDAISDLDTVISKDAENEEALLLKGEILSLTGKEEEGNVILDKVLELNPFNEKAYLIKGAILIEHKEFDKAIEVYNEAIELTPDNANLYKERGRAKLLKGDKEGSFEDLKKSMELNPEAENKIDGSYNNFARENKTGIY